MYSEVRPRPREKKPPAPLPLDQSADVSDSPPSTALVVGFMEFTFQWKLIFFVTLLLAMAS